MTIPISFTGNLTADPELRVTSSNKSVANFTVAVSERVRSGDQWVDGETSFFRVTVWEKYGENVAASLVKGSRVLVTGRLSIREYEVDGAKRSSLDVVAEEVGASLRFATAQVTRATPVPVPAAA